MSDDIRIRMYHVGFGDCFLVTFPGDRHMLIDCGVHFRDPDTGAVEDVVDFIQQHTGGELAVVVGTHRHVDHLSGFDSYKASFREMQAEEVWLPYYLESSHPHLRAWNNLHSRFVRVLGSRDVKLAEQFKVFEASNKRAIQTLIGQWRHSKPRRRWLSGESDFHESDAIPGVEIQLLGPLPDNPWVRKGEPENDDHYLAQLEYAADGKRDSPFADEMQITEADALAIFPGLSTDKLVKEQDLFDDYLNAHDATVNNQSLCFTLRYGDRTMLFTGDTEYGSWKAIYRDTRLLETLESIDLLKVSHHGSYNGTPASLIDQMSEFVSLVPTRAKRPFKSIPKEGLLKALKRHGPVVRADKPVSRRKNGGWYSVAPGRKQPDGKRWWTDIYLHQG